MMRHQWLYWLVCSCLFSCTPKTNEIESEESNWILFDKEVRTIVLYQLPNDQKAGHGAFHYKIVPVADLPYFYNRSLNLKGMDPFDLGFYTMMYKNSDEDHLHYMRFDDDIGAESAIEFPLLLHYGHRFENLITNRYHLMVRDVLHEENLSRFDQLTGVNAHDDRLLRSRYTFASYSGWNASASIIQRAGLKVGDPFVILFVIELDGVLYPLNLPLLKQFTDDYTIVVRP
ncbi:hypothetical protein PVA45_07930 (plasmid) [Entomospira entomophila]|uniref:Uncharacterized protein n=1 Tax=Entomospira entomophila TaxID=2719988 RepID=A0A968GA64_9SPIO|nr:hypothetical protein [Entomospira entomophilus]NIZ41433.1 hypothetical protein [Entomospira entomophilus]WDI36383.1 hypothetical protein PVA45_07930 [Entomospira entomophilus]